MQLKYLKPTLLLSLLFICPQLFAQQKSGKVMESFEQAIPEGFKATGEISLDSKRMKYGDTSLKWEWKGNDHIIFGFFVCGDLATLFGFC